MLVQADKSWWKCSMHTNECLIKSSGTMRKSKGDWSNWEKTLAHSALRVLHTGAIEPTPMNMNSKKWVTSSFTVISLCCPNLESRCFHVCKNITIINKLMAQICYSLWESLWPELGFTMVKLYQVKSDQVKSGQVKSDQVKLHRRS